MLLMRTALVMAFAVMTPVLATASPAVQPPWLGVGIVRGLHGGVRISEIIDDTPAAHAGLDTGDEILAVGSEPVTAPNELITAVSKHRIGDGLDLRVWRDGRVLETRVMLMGKPSEEEILHRRLVGKPAPFFDLPMDLGERLSKLANLRGHVALLAFAATECRVCARLHRRLSRFTDQHANDGLRVLAIMRDARETLDAWERSLVPSFDVFHDRGGTVAEGYRVAELPALVVVDRDGTVVYAGIESDGEFDAALLAAERALGIRRWL